MNLSAEERQLVTSSWAIVAKDLNAAGIALFVRLFTDNPDFQNLFSFRDVPNLDQLREDKRLKAHARNVMYTLSMVVDTLNDGDVLQEMVDKIARSHLRRKLTESHFVALKGALVGLLTDSLPPEILTPQALTAWSKTFDIFMEALAREKQAQQ